jgi:hypothetical protein
MRPAMNKVLVAQLCDSIAEIGAISYQMLDHPTATHKDEWNEVDSQAASLEQQFKDLLKMSDKEFESYAALGRAGRGR